MKKNWITLTMAVFAITVSASAQEKSTKESGETITIRKKGDSKEKLTIVIDGDKVTVNGKPLEDLKDSDVEVLKGKFKDYAFITPKMRGFIAPNIRIAPPGGMKMFGDGFMKTNKALLGVTYKSDDKGAKINEVTKESAAEKAGLKKDDIITKVGDTKITDSNDLYDAIAKYNPDEKVVITYLRNGAEKTTTATLQKNNEASSFVWKGDDNGFNFSMPDLGENFHFDMMSRKPRLGLQIQDVEQGNGIKILDVTDETPAAKAGLKKGDIINSINGKAVKNLDELKDATKDFKEGDSITIEYTRDGKSQSATVAFPKKIKTANL